MKRLWGAFAVILVFSFAVLGWIGTRIYQEMPPIPDRVVTTTGHVVVASGDIGRGQNVWQSMGGMETGSIWGHGSYIAPDWTADWLHRELVFVLNEWSNTQFGKPYDQLTTEEQAGLRGRLQKFYRTNTYDSTTGAIVIDPVRARAFEDNVRHYSEVFIKGNTAYAIPAGAISTPERMRSMAAFIFWSAWSAATNRPGDTVTYTQNWPHETLIGNNPTGEIVMWTGVSIIMLLGGLSAMIWWYASQEKQEEAHTVPADDPLGHWRASLSQRATLKYFWVVALLILVQMLMGVVTAHYGVEGDGFYGFKLASILPYSVTRTWHVQTGIFWIATAWLAAGLFIAPLVSKYEPKYQRLGVNVLFGALLAIVAGSMAGEWMSIMNKMTDEQSFLWGHQGYEYVDLGRFWQALLFVGLCIWLTLVIRSIRPALKVAGESKTLAVRLSDGCGRYRPVLRRGADVGPAHALVDRRILALVGGPPVGGGFLRGLCHSRDRILLHSSGADQAGVRGTLRPALGSDLPGRRHHWHLPPLVLLGDALRGARLGLGVQRFGSGSADSGGLRRMGRYPAGQAGSLGGTLPVAH